MTLAQQDQAVKAKRADPHASVEELVERASARRNKQIIVTLSAELHRTLQGFAKTRGLTQDAAAAELVAEGLAKFVS
jgi:predicted amino acid dehydrogenase